MPDFRNERWLYISCSECGREDYATRAYEKPIDVSTWQCSECVEAARHYNEGYEDGYEVGHNAALTEMVGTCQSLPEIAGETVCRLN